MPTAEHPAPGVPAGTGLARRGPRRLPTVPQRWVEAGPVPAAPRTPTPQMRGATPPALSPPVLSRPGPARRRDRAGRAGVLEGLTGPIPTDSSNGQWNDRLAAAPVDARREHSAGNCPWLAALHHAVEEKDPSGPTRPTDARTRRYRTATTPRSTVNIVPLTFRQACDYVTALHRHHRAPQGHKFSLGAVANGALVGVAIVGRPVARALDTGLTLEVTRVATDGTHNACSALYGAAWRTVRGMGYHRLITYTQAGESGASLRAVGWRRAAELSPRRGWDTPSRRRQDRGTDRIARILWEITTAKAGPTALPRNGICNEIPCEECGNPIPLRAGPGRPRTTCSTRCRARKHRAARSRPPPSGPDLPARGTRASRRALVRGPSPRSRTPGRVPAHTGLLSAAGRHLRARPPGPPATCAHRTRHPTRHPC
ncbi:hypothetical protein KAURM247S_05651 [Kitasatospora aureofaciens]